MNDLTIIIAVLIIAAAGLLLGFAKTLKFSASGITGIVLKIFLCVMLGGLFINLPFIKDLVNNKFYIIDKFFNISRIILYIILYFAISILLKLLLAVAGSVLESMGLVNRLLGCVYFVLYFLGLALVYFAFAKYAGGKIESGLLSSIQNTLLYKLYLHNPIVF